MQVGFFNCLFIFVIAALNDYVIVASIIVIAIRNSINCAALAVNADLEPKTHHQTPMTCTYGFSNFRHFKTVATEMEIKIKYMNYVPIVVATDLEVHFSVLKKGVSQYFCLYSVCTSHWCLVMSFWLKVCIYSHTRGVKLGLGLGFMQTSQVLPH